MQHTKSISAFLDMKIRKYTNLITICRIDKIKINRNLNETIALSVILKNRQNIWEGSHVLLIDDLFLQKENFFREF